MFIEDIEGEFKLVAPDVDALLRCFEHHSPLDSTQSTEPLLDAFEKVWSILLPLAPYKKNNEVKVIWIRVPRGTIEDYARHGCSFEEAGEYEDVKSYEEYVDLWKHEYPEENVWFELVLAKSFDRDGRLFYYSVRLGNGNVISAHTDESPAWEKHNYEENYAVGLCELILPAVQESIDLLKTGKYNELVEAELPYQFRTGVIRRADMRKYDPESKDFDYDGLDEGAVLQFKSLIESGCNDAERVGRIKNFTANDFFRACRIGYEAIGKDCSGFSLSELYYRYSDGRDEGLTGMGCGLNEGPGIDFDSPEAWDKWYNGKRSGGHPWEVVPGGNSTHMSLYVVNDGRELDYDLRAGRITQEEYEAKMACTGYYFKIVGGHRQYEAVSFYIALFKAGFPVIIDDAEELLARFEAKDYIGIVPHDVPTRYCESRFPQEYGVIIDFYHVYEDEDPWFEKIIWLQEEPARLIDGVME